MSDVSVSQYQQAPQQNETGSSQVILQKRALYPFKFIYKKTLGQVVNTYKVGARGASAFITHVPNFTRRHIK